MSDLYKLPKGWEWKPLNEVFIVKDGTHDSPKYIAENGYPLFTSKNLKEDGLDSSNFKLISEEDYNKINQRSKVDKGDLLFAMIGTIGNPTIIENEPNFAIKNVALFKPLNSENTIEYLRYYFLSNFVIDKMIKEAKGATQKFVGLTYLRNFPFPKIPLSEQQRLVSKLDLLFEKINKSIELHQKNMDEADVFMGSVLNDVFGELEENYPIKTLNDVCNKITDGTHKSPKTTESGYPYITVRDVTDKGKIDFDNCEFVNEEDFQKLKDGNCAPIKNDVLFSKDGTVGKVTVVDFQKDFVVLSSLAILRPSDNLDSFFLYFTMKSPKFFEFAQSKKTGAAIKRVVLRTIKEFEVPLPPLQIQQKVVKYLDDISKKVEKVKSIQKEKMKSLQDLKSSILDQAFRGEL